ncbi:MAG: cation diffusion facilitator family transporter [Solirubrobacteraceae bacterium]
MAAALIREPEHVNAMTVEAPRLKQRTAVISVVSNSFLILLKVIAGTVTGSVAILTEAVHSSIDLIASVVAYFSVRKAGEPADESHRYGHEKVENLAAAIEGLLILIGSAAIAFEAIRRLVGHGRVHTVGFGIAVVAMAMVVNVVVSTLLARTARLTDSPALAGDAAHLRTDALSTAAVLAALVLVKLTGAQWIDPAVGLVVAGVIVIAGIRLLARSSRVLVDQSLPSHEVDAIRAAIADFGEHGVVGYHELRTRRGGSRRYVDLHVQFRSGTSLENAHRTAHELQDVIAERLRGADVLIHLEPEDRVRPGEDLVVARPSTRPAHRSAPSSRISGD